MGWLNIIFLVGIPGSGKTTFAECLRNKLRGVEVASKDDFRTDFEGHYHFNEQTEPVINQQFLSDVLLLATLPTTHYLVIDNTNIKLGAFLDIFAILDNISKKVVFVCFESGDLCEHLRRGKHTSEGLTHPKLLEYLKEFNHICSCLPAYKKISYNGFDSRPVDLKVNKALEEMKKMLDTLSYDGNLYNNIFRGVPPFIRDELKKRVTPQFDAIIPSKRTRGEEADDEEEEEIECVPATDSSTQGTRPPPYQPPDLYPCLTLLSRDFGETIPDESTIMAAHCAQTVLKSESSSDSD